MIKKIVLTTLTSIILFSCVSVSAIPLGNNTFQRTDNPVSIFYSRDQIPNEYIEIAILNAKTSDGDIVSDETMISKLIEKGKEIGADGLIFESTNERESGGFFTNQGFFIQETKKAFRVIAIRYKS